MKDNASRWAAAFLTAAILGFGSGARAQAAPQIANEAPPSDSAALYKEIVDTYMAGDWDSLAKELSSKKLEISTLPKDQLEDVRYITQALNECHPSWWDLTKKGARVMIRPTVWHQTLTATYENAINVGISYQSRGSSSSITLTWPSQQMDNGEHGEAGFTKGELANTAIWSQVDQAAIWSGMSPERILTIQGEEKTRFYRYAGFRGITTAAYYGTPRAREWAAYLSLDAYIGDHTGAEVFIARKPFGAMFIAEIAGHPKTYPDFQLPATIDPANAESRMAFGLMGELSRVKLSFAEDKALRAAVKQFSEANEGAVFSTEHVLLPSKLIVELDPKQDAQAVAKRNQWLADALANGGEPATKPTEAGQIPARPAEH